MAAIIELEKEVYLTLIASLHEKLKEDWKRREERLQKYQGGVPDSNQPRFANYLDTYLEENTDCEVYHKATGVKYVSYNFIYERQLNMDTVWKTVKSSKLKMYLLYLGHQNLKEYLEKAAIFDTTPERSAAKQRQLAIIEGEKTPARGSDNILSYCFYTYHGTENTELRYRLEIDANRATLKSPKDNARLYRLDSSGEPEIGIAVFKYKHLHIFFPREQNKKRWMPLAMFFHIQEQVALKDAVLLIGTYSGVTSNTGTHVIAGEVILCQEQYIKSPKDDLVKRIQQRLHLLQYEVVTKIDISAQSLGERGMKRMLHEKRDDLLVLNTLIGKYDCFCIINDEAKIYRFGLEVFDDYSTQIYEDDETYWGRIETINDTVLINYRKQVEPDLRTAGLDSTDHCFVINTKPLRYTGEAHILKASFAGRTTKKTTEYAPFLLLKVPEISQFKRFSTAEIPAFLNEKPAYRDILRLLVQEHRDRWELIRTLGIDGF